MPFSACNPVQNVIYYKQNSDTDQAFAKMLEQAGTYGDFDRTMSHGKRPFPIRNMVSYS